jgi:hypothetical protein
MIIRLCQESKVLKVKITSVPVARKTHSTGN